MSKFKEKNDRRKESYGDALGQNRKAAREARQGRKLRNGAFGTATTEVYNDLVFGTSALPRIKPVKAGA